MTTAQIRKTYCINICGEFPKHGGDTVREMGAGKEKCQYFTTKDRHISDIYTQIGTSEV